jgi:hypothetical protein
MCRAIVASIGSAKQLSPSLSVIMSVLTFCLVLDWCDGEGELSKNRNNFVNTTRKSI